MLNILVKMFLVGIAHFALAVVLYYGRIKRLSPACNSDILVFLLPALMAFFGYFFFAWRDVLTTHRPSSKLALASLISIVALVISFMCFATFATNMWGT
jgi:hypothetical protein